MNTLNEVSPPTLQRLKISALCRISLSGSLLLAAGVAMSIVGYYSRQEASAFVTSDPLVPLSYLGPVVMGAGAFILIIVCVVTLESRDKSESKNSNWKNISMKVVHYLLEQSPTTDQCQQFLLDYNTFRSKTTIPFENL
ncbi:Transmembrane protein [Trichinella spiralis]|uniref:Transmembrane protein n=1 Tax=Trichinella spiralis TaxID=6334 RepID=A0ABR3KJ85_TRISP